MQHVPPFAIVSVAIKLLVAGYTPHVGSDTVLALENLLRFEDFEHDCTAAEQLRPKLRIFFLGRLEQVHAVKNPAANVGPIGHGRHWKRLVPNRQVIEDGLSIDVHATDSILNNDGNFEREGWIVGQQIRHWQREHMAVAVLVLQAFTGKRGSTGSAAEQEAAHTHVSGGPDQVANALEPEHGVINKKRDRIDPMIRVRSSGGNK